MIRSRLLPGLALAALAGGGAAAPAASGAATIVSGNKCNRYIPALAGKRYVPVGGLGFTPSGTVRLAYAGDDLAGYAPTTSAGSFLHRVLPPTDFISSRAIVKSYLLRGTDTSNGALTATTRIRMVRVAVRTPDQASPRAVVNYRISGFPGGKGVWAHYVFGDKRRASTYMGKGSRPCGLARKRQRFLPARVRYGEWRVYFSTRRRFSRRSFVLRQSFRVYRTFSRRAAAARTR